MEFFVNANNIDESFELIANELFQKYSIKTQNREYFLTEIEFYYSTNSKEIHDDPFTIKNPLQLTNGFWFFHYSGIDITIGNNIDYGGILIRGIKYYLNDSTYYIDGPMKCSVELLSSFTDRTHFYLELVKESTRRVKEILFAKRIGLSRNKYDPKNFKDKLYRFIIDDKSNHIFKNKENVTIKKTPII